MNYMMYKCMKYEICIREYDAHMLDSHGHITCGAVGTGI